MTKHWHILLTLTFLVATIVPGCRFWCPPPAPPHDVAAAYPPRPLFGYTPPHRLTPMETAPVMGSPMPQTPFAPAPMPPNGTRMENGARLAVPESGSRIPTSPDARLLPPEPSRGSTPEPVKPAVGEDRGALPGGERRMLSLPVGIPQFAGVKDQVSSGLKPLLDGLDWLRSAGYRTVLHIRAPGTDDSADRREVEKRGMKYTSIEMSPQTLASPAVEQFNRIVGDTSGQPLFVYDKDGTLAGGLWYLYFRTVERVSDEAARTQAARAGFKEAATDEQRAMWLAIQRYLSSQSRPAE